MQSWCRGVDTVIINGLSMLHFHMNILYLKVTGYPLIKFVDAKLYCLKAALLCLFCDKWKMDFRAP